MVCRPSAPRRTCYFTYIPWYMECPSPRRCPGAHAHSQMPPSRTKMAKCRMAASSVLGGTHEESVCPATVHGGAMRADAAVGVCCSTNQKLHFRGSPCLRGSTLHPCLTPCLSLLAPCLPHPCLALLASPSNRLRKKNGRT